MKELSFKVFAWLIFWNFGIKLEDEKAKESLIKLPGYLDAITQDPQTVEEDVVAFVGDILQDLGVDLKEGKNAALLKTIGAKWTYWYVGKDGKGANSGDLNPQ